MRRSLEADAPRELLDRVAADDELARLAVDVTEARLTSNDPVEAARFYRRGDETSFTSW